MRRIGINTTNSNLSAMKIKDNNVKYTQYNILINNQYSNESIDILTHHYKSLYLKNKNPINKLADSSIKVKSKSF